MEYEARVNYMWSRFEDPVICVYDLTRFRGDVIIDIMRTHPFCIVGGMLQHNPFYVEPDQFLAERRERGITTDPSRPVA